MRKLYILTTSTPRLDLHEKTYFKFLERILEISRSEKIFEEIVACINLDKTELFSQEELLEHVEKFVEKIKKFDSNDFEWILEVSKSSDFGIASAKTHLLASAEDPKENSIFMWLEDDWRFFEEAHPGFLKSFKTFLSDEKYQFMTFNSKQGVVNGWPFFFKNKFFTRVMQSIAKELTTSSFSDGEMRYQDVYEKMKKEGTNENMEFVSVDPGTFIDEGRAWREKKKIHKWSDKRASGSFTWGKDK